MIPATLVPWPTESSVPSPFFPLDRLFLPPLRTSPPFFVSTASLSWRLVLSTPVSITATLTGRPSASSPLVSCHSWSRRTRCSDHGVPLICLAGEGALAPPARGGGEDTAGLPANRT